MQSIEPALTLGRADAHSASATALSDRATRRLSRPLSAAVMLVGAVVALAFAVCLVPTQQAHADFYDQTQFMLGESYYNQDAATGTVYVAQGDGQSFDIDLDAGDSWFAGEPAVTSSNPAVATVSAGFWRYSGEFHLTITGIAPGASTISYSVPLADGTAVTGTLTARVFTIDLGKRSFTGFNYVLYKGLTVKPSIKGLPKGKWTSSNTAVAKVTSKGKISYKGLGACEVRGTFGPIEVTIPVDCTYKKAYQAVKNGFADVNAPITYSQAKRMKKSYRDCSSFVSRCYWDTSLKRKLFAIGGNDGKKWALTAADQAKWLNGQKKCVAKKGVAPSKLLAGDTVHTQTNYAGVNNRYRHIDHVTLYVGAGMVLSTGGGPKHDIYLRPYRVDPKGTYVKFIGRPCAEPALNLTKATLTKKKGANHSVTLKMQWAKGKVKWSSSNKKVATVNSKGKVVAKKKGTAKISAKVGGKTYRCKVTVK